MDKIEQYIINACVKNDPSIMELKMGCKVEFLGMDRIIFKVVDDEVHSVTESGWSFSNKLYKIKESPNIKILGRDIFIGDVLWAISNTENPILVDQDGLIQYWDGGLIKTFPWNLKKPLHEQEEETKLLLANILGFKE